MKPEPPVTNTTLIAAPLGHAAETYGGAMAKLSAGHKRKGRPWAAFRRLVMSARLFGGRERCRLGWSRGRFGGGFLLALGENELVALERDFAQAVHHRAGSGRDQTADDDVLLEAVERVGLAANR